MHAEPPHATHDQLRREIEALRASRERLVLAADADRRGIERELHEGLHQHLVALAVGLQIAGQLLDTDPGAAKTLVEEMREEVDRALSDAARLAERVFPPLLEADLGVALRAAVAGGGITASVEVAPGARYPQTIARTVYLCCLGTLQRAEAGAHARVAVHDEAGEVVFEVVVRGTPRGSAEHAAVGELGALRDRVEALGGQLAIVSETGVTRVSGSLPLAR